MKQKSIKFRCTEKFKTDIKVIAEQWGLTVSEYLIMLVYKDMGGNKDGKRDCIG